MIESKLRSPPSFRLWGPRTRVTLSAIWKRLIVVSRGLKELRPKKSTVLPPWRTSAPGSSVLEKPGSWSFATCTRSSLKNVGEKTDASEAFRVRVRTRLSPVPSSERFEPMFSLLPPVKFWWL